MRRVGCITTGRGTYAPWLGRWTSIDPAFLADGDNLYEFALNSPIRFRDPTGGSAEPSLPPGARKRFLLAAEGALRSIANIFVEAGRQLYDLAGMVEESESRRINRLLRAKCPEVPFKSNIYRHEMASGIGRMAAAGKGTGDIALQVGHNLIETPTRILEAAEREDYYQFGSEAMNLYFVGRAGAGLLRGSASFALNRSIGIAKTMGVDVTQVRSLQLRLTSRLPLQYDPGLSAYGEYTGMVSIGEAAFTPGLRSLFPQVAGTSMSRLRLRTGNLLRGNLLKRTITHEYHHHLQHIAIHCRQQERAELSRESSEFTLPNSPLGLIGSWNVRCPLLQAQDQLASAHLLCSITCPFGECQGGMTQHQSTSSR